MSFYLHRGWLLILLLAALSAQSQITPSLNPPSLLDIYNNETIRSSGNQFMKGTDHLKFRDLRKELNTTLTAGLYKKARSQRFLAGLCTAGGIAALAGSLIVRKNSDLGAAGLSVLAIGLNFGAFRFRKHSFELVDQAIWYRNKEILFNVRE